MPGLGCVFWCGGRGRRRLRVKVYLVLVCGHLSLWTIRFTDAHLQVPDIRTLTQSFLRVPGSAFKRGIAWRRPGTPRPSYCCPSMTRKNNRQQYEWPGSGETRHQKRKHEPGSLSQYPHDGQQRRTHTYKHVIKKGPH